VLCKKGSFDKYEYHGPKSCLSASILANGPKQCPFSCIGFGDCLSACQFGALKIVGGFLAVDRSKCTGCSLCVKKCPKNVIAVMNRENKVHVVCSSIQGPKLVAKSCSVGCIACGLCVKKCHQKAITITNGLAVIDYAKCDSCAVCISVCPRRIIEKIV
jgi:electron transport complex protein RnfB